MQDVDQPGFNLAKTMCDQTIKIFSAMAALDISALLHASASVEWPSFLVYFIHYHYLPVQSSSQQFDSPYQKPNAAHKLQGYVL